MTFDSMLKSLLEGWAKEVEEQKKAAELEAEKKMQAMQEQMRKKYEDELKR